MLALCAMLAALTAMPMVAQETLGQRLDAIVEKAIADDEIPGAVLVVGHQGKIMHRKAYGARAVLPSREAMTVDTIFDMASLTKPLATASSVMVLLDRGMVRLDDAVARYIPEFGANGKEQVTLRHLLTHTGGLRPVPKLPEKWSGSGDVLKAIYEDTLVWPPGLRFMYSDTGFIVLGELVRRVSGKPLEEFAALNVFQPLGMKETRFLPPREWLPRIAPTEEIELPQGAKAGSGKGRVLRGVVHDPRARGMGGVAGHAGLFSTADDLAKYCERLVELRKAALFANPDLKPAPFGPAMALLMTTAQTQQWVAALRGLGWDIDSPYSSPRGELIPLGRSFGHTGFTGTSIWIEPGSRTFVILLASSQHPYSRPAISSLRSRVATAVAGALRQTEKLPRSAVTFDENDVPVSQVGGGRRAARNGATKAGIDVLAEGGFAELRGKRVGLITNHTGVSRDGRSTIDLLHKAEGVQLVALFSPEHGIRGAADEKVASGVNEATGLPIHSLYGETQRRPTAEMLRGIDALVFDIQDAGVRFYTYITTMAYAMEEAAKHGILFYVLDRPNPLGGERVEGPMLDADKRDFVGYFRLPVVHGMTVGELAMMFNVGIGAELHVIAMQDWRRSDTFESTGLYWIAPSPNLRSLDAALLYPGVEILQAGGVSVGRGTDTPFELLGAPWINGVELAEFLNKRFVPGVRFVPVRFTPRDGAHKGVACEGVSLVITDRMALHSMLMGLELAQALWKLYPQQFEIDKTVRLVGNVETVTRLKKGDNPAWIVSDWTEELNKFRIMREKYLLYK